MPPLRRGTDRAAWYQVDTRSGTDLDRWIPTGGGNAESVFPLGVRADLSTATVGDSRDNPTLWCLVNIYGRRSLMMLNKVIPGLLPEKPGMIHRLT